MITTEYSKYAVRRKVVLEIEETRCLLVDILYFFGVKLNTVRTQFSTLLAAENAYDTLCETYQRGGYGSTDQSNNG